MPHTAQRQAAFRRLATINDTADYVGVHPKTVRRWIATGRLTALRAGPRLIRIDLTEVDVMLLHPLWGANASTNEVTR